jgi:SAM-dependent methyltransferase
MMQRVRRTGGVDFGDLQRLSALGNDFGWQRGLPIDRYYIDGFLARNARDIRGHVLEAGEDRYTTRFGSDLTKVDILDVYEGNENATIIADLTCADHLPSDTFDCIVLTQTIQMIYDVRAALRHVHRILKPGGVFLMTTHGISRICRREGEDNWGEYWHFTSQAIKRLFDETFPGAETEIGSHGNALTTVAFLHGLAVEDVKPMDLDYRDPDFELLITARAVKENSS